MALNGQGRFGAGQERAWEGVGVAPGYDDLAGVVQNLVYMLTTRGVRRHIV